MKTLLFSGLMIAAGCSGGSTKVDEGDPTSDNENPSTDVTDITTVPTDPPSDEGSEVTAEITEIPWPIPVGESRVVRGVVGGDVAPDALTVSWTSDLDGPQAAPGAGSTGGVTLDTSGLQAGIHQITLRAEAGDGSFAEDTRPVEVCEWPPLETFDTDVVGDGWTVLGDAAWDAGGWLEITGNYQSRSGAIFLTERRINPGNFRIEFDIATGGGINTGADGLAVSVIDAVDETELLAIVNAGADGGCLGYGVSGNCGSMTIKAFHVEFDTWFNSGDPVTDPTSLNHVELTLDGDPGTHYLWADVPSLEDLAWRHVVVEGVGSHLKVSLNGATVIDGDIPNFSFEGGYIGITASTGWATNYHRFDNLQIYDQCSVPQP